MSRSDVVRHLRSLAARGIAPSVRFLLPQHAGVVAEALASFGSFARARDAAHLDPPPAPADRDEVVAGLRALQAAGTRLEFSTLMSLGEAGLVASARRYFGSLEDAAAAAGVALITPPRVSARASDSARPVVRDVTGGDDEVRDVGPGTTRAARAAIDLSAIAAVVDRTLERAGRRARADLTRSLTEAVAAFAQRAADDARRTTLERLEATARTAPVAIAMAPLATAPPGTAGVPRRRRPAPAPVIAAAEEDAPPPVDAAEASRGDEDIPDPPQLALPIDAPVPSEPVVVRDEGEVLAGDPGADPDRLEPDPGGDRLAA